VKADLHALRLASFNQILDPWVYILFRKELLTKAAAFFKAVFSRHCCGCCPKRIVRRESRFERDESFKNSSEHLKSNYDKEHLNEGVDVIEFTFQAENSKGHPESDYKSRASGKLSFRSHGITEEADDIIAGDESVPLTEPHSCHLNLKHSACLFCLSKHPSIVVKQRGHPEASISSRSMIDLHDLETESASKSPERSNTLQVNPAISQSRRKSIHLSLEKLCRDGVNQQMVCKSQVVSCHG